MRLVVLRASLLLTILAGPAARAADALETLPPNDGDLARQSSGEDVEARLQAAFTAATPADGPATAVLVLRNERVLLRAARGLADMELGVAATPEHVFPIGSTTKPFTAALVLVLARDGKLSLDEPIAAHAPELRSIAGVAIDARGVPSSLTCTGWGRPTPSGPLIEPVPSELCERLPGTYISGQQSFTVSCSGGVAAIDGTLSRRRLRPSHGPAFRLGHRERATRVLFDLPEDGSVARAITLEHAGRTITARRK